MTSAKVSYEKHETFIIARFVMDGKCYKQIKTYLDTHDSEFEFHFCPTCGIGIGGGNISIKAGGILTVSCPSCLNNI